MSQAEYLKYNKDMQSRAATEKELADLAQEMVPATQQLQIAITKLGLAFAPVISIFTVFIDLLAAGVNGFNELGVVGDAILIVLGLGSLVLAGMAVNMAIVNAQAAIQASAFLSAALSTEVFTASMSKAALATAKLMGALVLITVVYGLIENGNYIAASAVAALTIGIYALATGFATLNASMGIVAGVFLVMSAILHMTQSPPFYMLFGFMAGLVVALALAFVFMQSVSMPVILALTAMAFGLSAMFYAISLLIDSMTAFFDLMLQNITLLPQLAMNLYTLVPAFMALGGALMYAGLGFGTFAAGALAAALVLAGGSIVFLGAAVAMAPLVAEIFLLGEGFEKMGNGIEKISKALQLVSAITGGGEESFFALSSDGTQTSIVAAKGGMLKTFSSDKLTVDVKMPEINVPQPIVHVYIDGKEVSHSVKSMLGRDTGAG
jgi:hypothetical protein